MSPLDDPDESSILRRAWAGDDEAWSTIVLRHGGMLRRLASIKLDPRLRTRIDPADVVQEALLDAFQALGKFFATPLPFAIWLRQRLMDRIHRGHRDHLETRKRGEGREVGAVTGWDVFLRDPGTTPSGPTRRVEDGSLLREAFGQLADVDREVLFLFFFEEYSHGEIAAILGTQPATVRKRLSRAVARLEASLRRSHPEWCHAFEYSR